ncbi:hypothetical protein KP509_28G048900 [Ceratopteris richardii]|uniref:Uncharacterized protein n=1 Tax=Ceratopteris richardii TaxID=49495 RepID=A0A8T2REG5_CERRI|nr:hypothetical protein KP509_28G048900 [Ceratopteris richardii]
MGNVSASVGTTVRESVNSIGWLIAAASAAILASVGWDAWRACAAREWWFPCRLVHISAVTQAVLTVATKLPNDISTPMPGVADQLVKLSGSALLCALLAFTLPTVADTERPPRSFSDEVDIASTVSSSQGRHLRRSDMVANVMALGLLVLTTAANLVVQILIEQIRSEYYGAHVALIITTLICFGNMATAALFLPHDYVPTRLKHFIIPTEKLGLESSWFIARVTSKQYALSRSDFGCGGGAMFSILMVICFSAIVKATKGKINYNSNYGASVWLILIVQSITVFICWLCITTRWLRCLLISLEDDPILGSPDSVNLKNLWRDSAYQDDIPWWKMKHGNRARLVMSRLLIMSKKVPYCVVQQLMTLLCARTSMILWHCCWKLCRYPASCVAGKIWKKEDIDVYKRVEKELEACLHASNEKIPGNSPQENNITSKLQDLWLINKPIENLSIIESQEDFSIVERLVKFLHNHTEEDCSGFGENGEEQTMDKILKKYAGEKDKQTVYKPLSLCGVALVMMDVCEKLKVFTNQEVEEARGAMWEARHVAYLVELLARTDAEERRSTQRMLADLFLSRKAIIRIKDAVPDHKRDGESLLQVILKAIELGKQNCEANPRERWIKETVQQCMKCILKSYIESFDSVEKDACRIAREYDCEQLCSLAHIARIIVDKFRCMKLNPPNDPV